MRLHGATDIIFVVGVSYVEQVRVEPMKTIMLAVPHGILSGTVLRTILAELFRRGGFEIVVLSPREDSAGLTREFEGSNVHFEDLHTYRRGKLEVGYDTLRSYILANPMFSETINIKTESYRRKKPISRALRWLMLKTLLKRRRFRDFVKEVGVILFRDPYYGGVFEKWRPDALFLAYPFGYDTVPIFRRSVKNRVPMIVYIPSWDNLTSKGELPAKPDRLIVWNEIMKGEAVSLHDVPAEHIYVTGVPQFDIYADRGIILPREEFFRRLGADPEKKLITYSTGTAPIAPQDPDIVRILYSFIREGRLIEACQLLVRLHPRRSIEDFAGFEDLSDLIIQRPGRPSEAFRDLGYYWETDEGYAALLANTLAHSDVVVNIASTLSIEACIFDTPVINIAFDGEQIKPYWESTVRYYDYTHYRNIVKTGGVRVAQSKEELLSHLNAYLKDPELDSEKRGLIVSEQCVTIDGKAGERIAECIIAFVRGL